MPPRSIFDQKLEQLENWHMGLIVRLRTFRHSKDKDPAAVRDALVQYAGMVAEILEHERVGAG